MSTLRRRQIRVFLASCGIPMRNRILGAGQVCLHGCLFGDYVAAKSVARSGLLLLQMIQAGIHRSGAAGKLIKLVLQLGE